MRIYLQFIRFYIIILLFGSSNSFSQFSTLWEKSASGGTLPSLFSTTHLERGMPFNGIGAYQGSGFINNHSTTIDWCNLQYPPEINAYQGDSSVVYAQVYIANVTNNQGVTPGLECWIGVNSTNSNPANWTKWYPADFNVQVGNNDEFWTKIGYDLPAGKYYYASRFRYNEGGYYYGGLNNMFWDSLSHPSGILKIKKIASKNIALRVQDNTPNENQLHLFFGSDSIATIGFDPLLGEEPLPLLPPAGVFDARFELPLTPPDYSIKDYRSDTASSNTWILKFQPGAGGYPITINWDTLDVGVGNYRMKDLITGDIINIDMKGQSEVVITNPGITSLQINYSRQTCKQIPLAQGWNMVSIPIEASDMRKETLFANANSNLFGYSNGYQTKDTAEIGKGYWIRYGSSEVIELCGSQSSETTIPINTGWNLIGIYDKDVQVTGITTTPGNILNSYFFGYSTGYIIPATLSAGKGYWIRANQNGVINLNSTLIAKGTETPLINEKWTSLTLTDRTGKTSRLYLSEGKENLSSYNLPPVPPEGIYDVRFASDRMVEDLSGRQEIVVNSGEYPVEIGLKGLGGLGSLGGLVVEVEKGSDKIEWILRDGETILVGEGSRIFVESVEIPADFSLSQNYPNPFNPSTVISYQLPVDSKVTLKLYDVLGREVATLIDEQKEAGNHNYQLSIRQLTDYQLTSGVYFYEIVAGEFRSVKKMVLMK